MATLKYIETMFRATMSEQQSKLWTKTKKKLKLKSNGSPEWSQRNRLVDVIFDEFKLNIENNLLIETS